LKLSRDNAIKIFKSIGFENYESISEDEYVFALNSIDRINNCIYNIKENYSSSMIEKALRNLSGYQRKYSEQTMQELVTHKQESEKLLAGQDMLKKSCSDFDFIPKDCNHKLDCVFIASIIKAKSNLLPDKDYDALISLIEGLDKDIKQLRINIDKEDNLLLCIRDIRDMMNIISSSASILAKFSNKEITSSDIMKLLIEQCNGIELDTRKYLEYTNFIGLIKSTHEDIKALKEQLSSISANKSMIDMLTEDINKLTTEYRELSSQREAIMITVRELTTRIDILKSQYDNLKKLLEERAKLQDMLNKKKEIEEQLPKLYNGYQEAQNLNISINTDMIELNDLNTNKITEVTNEINKNKYKLVLHNDYNKEYKEYSEQYEKVETIKYYVSPTTGFQTIMMEYYMNDILVDSNKLLSLFFNGEFVLHPFVINENEFRIPCLGKGLIHDDVSSMSTAQVSMISMILSFALLNKASNTFDIVKLDEIDGGLDTNNRLQFIVALRQLMDILNYSQCVMISHNSELSMYNADIIILKNTDPDFKPVGNIIYQYGGM
jgi:hypothetical protein